MQKNLSNARLPNGINMESAKNHHVLPRAKKKVVGIQVTLKLLKWLERNNINKTKLFYLAARSIGYNEKEHFNTRKGK